MYFETNCFGGSPEVFEIGSGRAGIDWVGWVGDSNCLALEDARLGIVSGTLKDVIDR